MPRRHLGPRFLIAGTSSGVGKTTVTTALLSAFHHKGMCVAPAKVGPDFIDPTYHELACGKRGCTLDTFLLGKGAIAPALMQLSRDADLTIIEGVMGLFDGTLMRRAEPDRDLGIDPKLPSGSTAEVAALTQTPVILILDASATSSSLAAVVEGFSNFSRQITLAGLVINNYGSPSHLELIKTSLKHLDVEIVGAIPRGAVPPWRSRHLGLVPVIEDRQALELSIKTLTHRVAPLLDLDKILEIADSAPAVSITLPKEVNPAPKTRIAVARGKAFSFVYPENLVVLEQSGAELAYFDPLTDTELPKGTRGLIAGGGFPEVFAEKLSKNLVLNNAVKLAITDGLPTWAECGGLMWLADAVDAVPMVGAIPTEITMTNRLTLGYVRANTYHDNCLTRKEEPVYGHEFHYSQSYPAGPDISFLSREGTKKQGFTSSTLFASYLHIHLGSQRLLAERFVSNCT
ncbi:MAG: cobyrinate a,c-diamide synthase [Actinomycetota bacterium]|jgi:cobyrinic acid a,c-diamide synthase|nr:cobyrinate a,c-diamide synthase [Actinomycetota bacterium]